MGKKFLGLKNDWTTQVFTTAGRGARCVRRRTPGDTGIEKGGGAPTPNTAPPPRGVELRLPFLRGVGSLERVVEVDGDGVCGIHVDLKDERCRFLWQSSCALEGEAITSSVFANLRRIQVLCPSNPTHRGGGLKIRRYGKQLGVLPMGENVQAPFLSEARATWPFGIVNCPKSREMMKSVGKKFCIFTSSRNPPLV